jgi:hypothetical protein
VSQTRHLLFLKTLPIMEVILMMKKIGIGFLSICMIFSAAVKLYYSIMDAKTFYQRYK